MKKPPVKEASSVTFANEVALCHDVSTTNTMQILPHPPALCTRSLSLAKNFGSVENAGWVVRMRKHGEIPNRNKPEKVPNITPAAMRAWLQKA